MSEFKLPTSFQPKPPPADPAEIHFKRAWQHRKNKQYRDAVNEFQESLKHNPDKGSTHFNLGLVYDRLEQGAEAVVHLQQAVAIFQKANKPSNVTSARNLLNKLYKKYPDLDPDAQKK